MARFSLNRIHRVPLLLVCLALVGCGGSGHRVSGKVTFAGQPVKSGKIYFIPNSAKGNKGQSGYATIVDGKYDTASPGGLGAIKGPMIIAIEAVDPDKQGKKEKGDTSGEVTVAMLFPRYEVEAEISGDMTKDFDVPADAAHGPKQVGPSVIVP